MPVRRHGYPRHARQRRAGEFVNALGLPVLALIVVLGSLYVASPAGRHHETFVPTPHYSASTSVSSTSSTVAVTVPPTVTTPAVRATPPLARPAAPAPARSPRAVTAAPPPARARPPVPPVRPHIMMIMMENQSYNRVIGNASLPYLNGTLASHYLVLQQAFAVGHPSLPNYLELLSGSTWGVSSDCSPGPGCQGGASLPNQLDQAGISWAGYMENMPTAGYTGGDTGGADGYGNSLYVQHHNPFVYFPSLAGELITHVKPLLSMVADLNSPNPPAFTWVSPNMVDNMHDGPLTTGDAWLSQQIPAISTTKWYRDGGTIILLWDEGQASDTAGVAGGHGGHVAGIVISQALYGSAPSATPIDHAGILRSIEKTYGLGYLGDAADPVHGTVGL
jgi:hypothetical protein